MGSTTQVRCAFCLRLRYLLPDTDIVDGTKLCSSPTRTAIRLVRPEHESSVC